MTKERWKLISPLVPRGFLCGSVLQHFCLLLDQVAQAIGAQYLFFTFLGVNKGTAKMELDLDYLHN